MKRNCNKCKALTNDKCVLGHEIAEGTTGFKPLEECEKPTTKKAFDELMQILNVEEQEEQEEQEEIQTRTPQEVFDEWSRIAKNKSKFRQRNWTSMH